MSAAPGQLVRYALVGAANTLLSYAVYAALLRAGAPYLAATALAFCAGAVNGYALNRRWTFAARDSRRARLAYVAVQALALVAGSLAVWGLVRAGGVPRLAAYALAIPPVTLASFAANRAWTFARQPIGCDSRRPSAVCRTNVAFSQNSATSEASE